MKKERGDEVGCFACVCKCVVCVCGGEWGEKSEIERQVPYLSFPVVPVAAAGAAATKEYYGGAL